MSQLNAPQDTYDEKYVQQFYGLNKHLMDTGKSPLLKTGTPEREAPFDPVNGIVHDGMNGLFLENVAELKGFKDPRWIRDYDLRKKGLDLKHGQKGNLIAYHNKYQDPSKGLEKAPGEKRYYVVYNAEQIMNYPSLSEDKYNHAMKNQFLKKKQYAVEKNTPDGKKPLEVVRGMVMQQKTTEAKELSLAYAAYRHSQDLRTPYAPYDPEKIVEQSRGSVPSVMKSAYVGATQAKKMLNEDRSHTTGLTREFTSIADDHNSPSVKMKQPRMRM
jgi:hypothetical protein